MMHTSQDSLNFLLAKNTPDVECKSSNLHRNCFSGSIGRFLFVSIVVVKHIVSCQIQLLPLIRRLYILELQV